MIKEFKSLSPAETQDIGLQIANLLQAGDTVALIGEMGAGKTVMAKGICQGLGYNGEVTSPSYIHVHQYAGVVDILHVDFYLDESEKSIFDLGLDEYIGGDYITLIEWADRFPQFLPENCWWIKITLSFNVRNNRKIILSRHEN